MKKRISRKFALTITCIVIVTALTVIGAVTHTEVKESCWIIAVACGVYNLANVGQKLGGKGVEQD